MHTYTQKETTHTDIHNTTVCRDVINRISNITHLRKQQWYRTFCLVQYVVFRSVQSACSLWPLTM